MPEPAVRMSPSEKALSALSALIASKNSHPGQILSERRLSSELGVSRVVIREAMKKLEQQGLVRIRHGKGVELLDNPALPVAETITRALPDSRDRLQHCALARRLIEPEIAAIAALRATPSDVERLGSIAEAMKVAQSVNEAANLDIALHDAITEIAGNKVLILMLQSIAGIGRDSRAITICRVGTERACLQHAEILAAIAAKNAPAARRAMKKHLESTLADLGFELGQSLELRSRPGSD